MKIIFALLFLVFLIIAIVYIHNKIVELDNLVSSTSHETEEENLSSSKESKEL